MIVICEECGKKYNVDPSKIRGQKAKSKCKVCGNVIIITKPEVKTPRPLPTPPPVEEDVARRVEPPVQEPEPPVATPERTLPSTTRMGFKGVGVRGKMLVLFVFIPILMMAGAGLFYMKQMYTLSDFITGEGNDVITNMAEQAIAENARSVAKQTRLYLLSHPQLRKESFNTYDGFKDVAVQKVGLTGYTALYELPGPDNIWRTWAHVNPKIIGIDMSKLRKPLGDAFPGFWRVYVGVKGGKESKGYYTWQDKDGRFREKFMVCTPVEGTSYIIASTTYLDEFTTPMKRLEGRARGLTKKTRNINVQILAGTLILIGLIVSLYGHRLISRIKHLTDVTERISVGELDAEIEIKSKDELGTLADAISRMQDSIRLSMVRLRGRR